MLVRVGRTYNRPFPSSRSSHFQNKANCKTFLVKMSFICKRTKNHFHINGFALCIVLKQGLWATWKMAYFNSITNRNHYKFHIRAVQFKVWPVSGRLLEYYKDLVLSTSVDREAKVLSGICGYNSRTYHKAKS